METKIARPPLIEVSPIANAHTTIIFPPYTALPIRYHTTIPPHTVLLYFLPPMYYLHSKLYYPSRHGPAKACCVQRANPRLYNLNQM